MKYARPEINDPTIKTKKITLSFGGAEVIVPSFETPIPIRENFFRAARRENPMWVPYPASDIQSLHINELATPQNGMQQGPDFINMSAVDYTFLDPFGNSWTWVTEAGGAMLTPHTKILEDICDWEKVIKFPNFNDWDFRERAEKYMKERYDPDMVMHINIHQGLTEMLVAFLGGYEEGMTALAIEPEACKDFFARFAKYMTDFFDMLDALYPIDFITYHDDWGTERDTFFSSKMMEELVYEPTKTIVDHIRGRGKVFELHSCGKIERFLPYMCDLNIDLLQIQRRANDMPMLKQKYGDRIGFNVGIEGLDFNTPPSKEELCQLIRNTIDIYGAGGGVYPSTYAVNPDDVWTIASEFYFYSREFYENK